MSDQIPALPRYLHAPGGVTRLVHTSEAFADAIADGYVVDPNTLPPAAADEGEGATPAPDVDETPAPVVDETPAKKKKAK